MKKFIVLLLSLAMVAALAACGQSSNNGGGQTTAAPAGETTAAPAVETAATDETIAAGTESVEIDSIVEAVRSTTTLDSFGTRTATPGMYEVYEMLYECDFHGEIVPFLADATYEGNFMPGCDHEEGTGIYTVHIYDYIKDHKGRDVKASDVAFSFLHSLNEANTSGWKDNLLDVVAKDDTTVEFQFASEQNGVGQLLNIFCRCIIVNEESYNESPSHLADEMVGTGPYKFESYVSGAELVIVKNEDYWQTDESVRRQEQQANVKKITYKFIDESSQQLIGLKTGELDFVPSVKSKDAVDFQEGGEFADKFKAYIYPDKMIVGLYPNCDPASPMGNVDLRLAVFNAIDQNGLITARGGYDIKLDAYANAYYSDYDYVDWSAKENYNSKTSVDMNLVKEHLDKSGYAGETLIILGSPDQEDDLNVLVNMLIAAGINAQAKTADMNTQMQLMTDPKEWDLCYGMMAGDYNVTVWQHAFSYGNFSTKDRTQYLLVDDEWEDMLNTLLTEEGHTPENMEKWWDHATENAYVMALYASYKNDIIPANMTFYTIGDKNTPLLGASIYE